MYIILKPIKLALGGPSIFDVYIEDTMFLQMIGNRVIFTQLFTHFDTWPLKVCLFEQFCYRVNLLRS